MAIAIVAIPSDDNPVWKFSSEKVPHVTLLFLGNKLRHISRVEEHVEHVVRTSARKFFLEVDRRGVLGDKKADVLFFGKYGTKKLEEIRRYLLMSPDILAAYNSVEQFPVWTPHLTMGYPESPAKPDNRDYPGISYVNFDKIALWTGDYEGTEFMLKNEHDLVDEMAMSEKGLAFLQHYGIKGMRWGVRRSDVASTGKAVAKKVGEAYRPSKDAIDSQKYMTRAKLGGVRNLNNHEMQLVINRMNLERQYKELYGERQWTNKGAKWAGKFVTDVLRDASTSWLSNPFARGRRSNDGPIRTTAWSNGQQFAGVIEGNGRKAIGR